MNVMIFGAGKIGVDVAKYYLNNGYKVICFVDNNKDKCGTYVDNIPIISFEQFLQTDEKSQLVIACSSKYQKEIVEQLVSAGVKDYVVFNRNDLYKKERLISYSHESNLEDVVLYHVLKEEKKIFYIDIGSNDPYKSSVTKLLYDMKNASGINVEPQKALWEISNSERPRDINLCVGVGSKPGVMRLYHQGELSTIVEDNVLNQDCVYEEIEITTLSSICEEYVNNQSVQFLKIDVEGAEKEVLLGADFKRYRPWIIVMESTRPTTDDYNYNEWENILLDAEYHYVYSKGVNRYYVANEMSSIDDRFKDVDDVHIIYNIYLAGMQRI